MKGLHEFRSPVGQTAGTAADNDLLLVPLASSAMNSERSCSRCWDELIFMMLSLHQLLGPGNLDRAVILLIDNHHRRHGAGSDTGDDFEREFHVRVSFVRP